MEAPTSEESLDHVSRTLPPFFGYWYRNTPNNQQAGKKWSSRRLRLPTVQHSIRTSPKPDFQFGTALTLLRPPYRKTFLYRHTPSRQHRNHNHRGRTDTTHEKN